MQRWEQSFFFIKKKVMYVSVPLLVRNFNCQRVIMFASQLYYITALMGVSLLLVCGDFEFADGFFIDVGRATPSTPPVTLGRASSPSLPAGARRCSLPVATTFSCPCLPPISAPAWAGSCTRHWCRSTTSPRRRSRTLSACHYEAVRPHPHNLPYFSNRQTQ